jgi:pimeloyl-ACP methyl ester carboxylesterase
MPVISSIDVAGGPLEYELTTGSPSDPVLAFLHEGLGSLRLWRDLPSLLAAACGGPRTLVWSRHGYGWSAAAVLPRPVSYMHHEAYDVLPELFSMLSVDAPVLIGHSDGASIALLHASAGHPVKALVLFAPHVFVEERTLEGIRASHEAFAGGDLRARLARHHADVDATFRGWNDVWLSAPFAAWDIVREIGRVQCPVLIIQGVADAYGSTEQVDRIAAAVSGPVERVVLANVGHAPHVEARAVTVELVSDFLRRHQSIVTTRARPG